MEARDAGDAPPECPTSPYRVLQEISGEAVRVAGEALQNVYSGSSNFPPLGPGRKHNASEASMAMDRRNSSFQKWKSQMKKALRWGNSSRELSRYLSFNPEVLANQKRQWYESQSKTLEHKKYMEPTSLFEHFIIAGLHPDTNLEVVEDAFAKRKKWESEMEKPEMAEFRIMPYKGPQLPTLEPQILFKHPPGKRLAVRMKDLAAFCFPGAVKARVLERTPSLSDLNELVYGQEHLGRDDSSFIFSLKVANNVTLYGVCLHVQEIVQRPPAILGAASPLSQSSGGCSRFLVSAPRCYCFLTRVPFFELHYELLNSIIAQERLDRITQFVNEMSFTEVSKSHDRINDTIDSPYRDSLNDWMAFAIPIDSAVALAAAAAGIISDDEVPSSSKWEPQSPESVTASEASDHSQAREIDKDDRKNLIYSDDNASEALENSSEALENRSDALEKMNGSCDSGQSHEAGLYICPRGRTLERQGSSESLFSSVRSIGSEDEDDEFFCSHEKDAGDEMILEWAQENKNDFLQILCSYYAIPLPSRGSTIVFQPLEHLQAIEYKRTPYGALGFSERFLDKKLKDSSEAAEVNMKLAAAEEAVALSIWTTATICRVLSLENVLALLTGVLLEKQVVIVCSNLGILSATVLSLIPMIRPFEWQSLLLPVLPGKMLDFLDAPVPFIVGIHHLPADLKMKTSNRVYVNVFKNQVKMCYLPTLPRRKELISELEPIHARLSFENPIAKRHPVYKCNEVQAEAATQFLTVMRRYLESLCSNLRSHTITSIQSNDDRVSLLLKDSFIDSFLRKDQPFIKQLVETQLFSVLSDTYLSGFEAEH